MLCSRCGSVRYMYPTRHSSAVACLYVIPLPPLNLRVRHGSTLAATEGGDAEATTGLRA